MRQYPRRDFVNRNQLYTIEESLFDLPFDPLLQPCPSSTPQSPSGGESRAQWRGPVLAGRGLPSKSLPKPTASQETYARCRDAGGPTVAWPLSVLILFQPFNWDNEEQEIHQSHISPVILTPFNKCDDT